MQFQATPRTGLEPVTPRLTAACSTFELSGLIPLRITAPFRCIRLSRHRLHAKRILSKEPFGAFKTEYRYYKQTIKTSQSP